MLVHLINNSLQQGYIQDRLRAVVGPTHAGLYGYDGNGNRVWKLIGQTCNTTWREGTIM